MNRNITDAVRKILTAVVIIAVALLLSALLTGCGESRENAKLQRLQLDGLSAAKGKLEQLAKTDQTPDETGERDKLYGDTAYFIDGSIQAGAVVYDHLAFKYDDVELDTGITAQEAFENPESWGRKVTEQIPLARKETQDRAWWSNAFSIVGGWINTALSSWLGITLGATGVGGIVGAAALWVGRIRKALKYATEFGDTASEYIENPALPIPDGVRSAWKTAKGGLAKAQEAANVQGTVDRYRPTKVKIVVPETVTTVPEGQ